MAGPADPGREHPAGGGCCGRGRCWLGGYSPLRGCADGHSGSELASLPPANVSRRRTPRNCQTGSYLRRRRRRRSTMLLMPSMTR